MLVLIESFNFIFSDGKIKPSKRKAALEARQAKELAALNKETHMHQTLIPRTQRLDTRQCQPMHPQQFAAILIEKLETVKREQDSLDLLDKKLSEVICLITLFLKSS